MSSKLTFQALLVVELFYRSQVGLWGLAHQAFSENDVFSKEEYSPNIGLKPWQHAKGEDGGRCSRCQSAAHIPRAASCRADDQSYVLPRSLDEAYSPALATICEVYEEEEDTGAEVNTPSDLLQTQLDNPQIHSQYGRPDMCDILTPETHTNQWVCEPEELSERNDALLRLQLDRRSLIIDSPCPDLAPHIVITPPDVDDAWDLYWAAWSNRIGIQDSQFLLVPTLDDSPSPLASFPPHPDLERKLPCDKQLLPEPTASSDYQNDLFCSEPRRVCSLSRLREQANSTSQERELVYLDNVIMAVRRRYYKVAVLAASAGALAFRARWDKPEFMLAFERPFRWTDAAEPLLSMYSQTLGATIIDSITPCTTPHIIIQEPPPEQSWALYHNTIPNPQDGGLGYYLTVPSPFVDIVNLEPNPFESEYSCGEDMLEDASSPTVVANSEGSLTPGTCECDADLTSSAEYAALERDETRWEPQACSSALSKSEESPLSDSMADSYDAGGEDGLPPFDDWYQEIARRAA